MLALHYVSGIDEESVLRVCAFHGFVPRLGMFDEEWQEAARELGVRTKSKGELDIRLNKFIKENPEGLFLVTTRDHLFVIDNGLLVDPLAKDGNYYPGMRRVVRGAWRILG